MVINTPKLTQKTRDGYKQVGAEILKFNKELIINDITKETVELFESHLIEQRFLNNTIHTHIGRFIAVLNYYQRDYELNNSYNNYKFELRLKEDNVIFHTKDELKALREATFTARMKSSVKKLNEVRDLALVMAETALRFSDSYIKQTDIKNGVIVKKQQKTKQMVYIPLTERVKTILEKYNYNLKGKNSKNWNINYRKILKQIAEQVPTLKEMVTVVNYIGSEEIEDTRMKWEHCSSHTLRRTMINQTLLRGMKYHQITRITGHRNFKAFETYINKNTRLEELDEVFDFLNNVNDAIMKVAS